MAPRSSGGPRRSGRGPGRPQRHPLHSLLRARPRTFYSHRASRGTDGRMVAYLGMPGSVGRARVFRLTPGGNRSSFSLLSRGRRYGPTVRCGGVPPHFFSAPMSVDALLHADSRPSRQPRLRAGGSQTSRNDAAPHPAGAGGPPGQPTRPGCDGRRLCGASAGPSSDSWNPGPWWARAMCSRCPHRDSSGRCAGRSTGDGSSGSRARVRSPALGGRRVVEIVAVPDDEHVTLRPEQGGETTLRLDDSQRSDAAWWTGPP